MFLHDEMRTYSWRAGLIVAVAVLTISGCTGGQTVKGYRARTGGNAQRGKQIIAEYRCGACHTIPGIRNANGVFGPPLNFFSRRSYIGGNVANTPANLIKWIKSPPSLKPKTAMPALGLSEQQARDAAAYLDTLK